MRGDAVPRQAEAFFVLTDVVQERLDAIQYSPEMSVVTAARVQPVKLFQDAADFDIAIKHNVRVERAIVIELQRLVTLLDFPHVAGQVVNVEQAFKKGGIVVTHAAKLEVK